MADVNIVRLMNGLLSKTNDGQLRWVKTEIDGTYCAKFTSYSVEINSTKQFNPDIDDVDEEIKIRVLDNDDNLIEEIQYNDFDQYELAGEEYPWKAFKALHGSARRSALGMDKAIASIVDELLGDDEGQQEIRDVPAPPLPADDDIPI